MPYNTEIEELRSLIDNLDAEIIDKIAELKRTSKKIVTRHFCAHTLVLNNINNLAHEYNLDAEGIEHIFNAINDLLPKTGSESS